MRYVIYVILCLTTCFQNGWAQQSFTPLSYSSAGFLYTQQFDSLPVSGIFLLTNKGPFAFSSPPFNINNLIGWQFMMSGGSNSSANFGISTGSSTGNGVYSFGNTGNTDRALGSLSSGTGIYAFGLIITNNTGSLLNKFSLHFIAEQWRKGGSTNKNAWALSYTTGVFNSMQQTALQTAPIGNFNSVNNTSSGGSLDGNLAGNQLNVSFSISGINWKNGEQLLLRWDDADESGSDDGVGIDNFSFSAQLESSVPDLQNINTTNITTNAAKLNGTVQENNANTNVVFAYDTLNNFPNPISINAVPGIIYAGSGLTNVFANITGLLSGTAYYYRMKAGNINGTTVSNTGSFTTTFQSTEINTVTASYITGTSAILGGSISNTGSLPILEKGIVWSLQDNPTITDNKISMGIGFGNFSQTVSALPQGTLIYVKAYARTSGTIAYGNSISFSTKTKIVYIHPLSAGKTNDSLVRFEVKYLQSITGISPSNFGLQNTGLSGIYIKTIIGAGDSYTITVNTGMGDGSICLSQINNIGLVPEMDNLPFVSNICYTIDKSAPVITAISIPNNPMIIDDTIPILISVKPDRDIYKMNTGNIQDYPLFDCNKINDSTYSAFFTIKNNSNDVAASDNLPATLSLKDSIGNIGLPFQYLIIQSNDLIDANRPFIKNISIPAGGLYKAGDTLDFVFHFSEKLNITVSVNPSSFSITIGTKVKAAVYTITDSLENMLFRYIIQAGDLDKDGIKTASSILLKETIVKDLAGNIAVLGFNNPPSTKNIFIDAIAPTISSITTPAAGIYKTGNKLDFIVNYTKKVLMKQGIVSPTLSITIGTKQKNAIYKTGSGSSALLFSYTIEKDDFDKDGIKLISPLNLNDASLTDELGNTASLTLSNIGSLSKININPVTAAILNVSFPFKGLYKKTDSLRFSVHFSENIFVNLNSGTPSLKITIGTLTNHAYYTDGSGTNRLSFIYIVQPGEADTNGIKINSSISLNNGSIKDSLGNNVPVSLNNIGSGSAIYIDGVSPTIKTVSVPAKKTYTENDTLNFYINFSEKVIRSAVSDTPYITMHIGTATRKLNYFSGSENEVWLFRYIVQKGDLDKNGIRLDSNIIAGNSNPIDVAGNAALLSLKNIGAQSFVKIDAVAPAFYSDNTPSLVTCENNSELLISNPLTVIDEEVGEQIVWQIIDNPQHGTISKNSFQSNSTGKPMVPNGIFYYPDKHYHGLDSFIVQVSDNINTAQKKVSIQIHPVITNNSIGPAQMICINNIPETIVGSNPVGGDEQFQINWEASTVSDTSNFIKINNATQIHFHPPSSLSQTTWVRRKVISAECIDITSASQIQVIKNGIWSGSTNTDWQNKNNWCNGEIPDIATDVFINGNAPNAPIVYDSASCHHLTFLNNTVLTVKGILQIGGMINNISNQIDAINGTIIFSGKVPQTIPKNIFKSQTISRLIINNSAAVYLTGKLIITKMLQLQNGAFITNHHLLLDYTAEIGPSAAGTSITDTVSFHKLISGGKKGFRLLGNPFSHDLSLNILRDSIDITGIGGNSNGFTNSINNEPSAFHYDPMIGNDSAGIDAGWIAFTNTNNQPGNLWKQETGIRIFYRGSPRQGLDSTPAGNGRNGTYHPNATMLMLSGTITTGDKEIKLNNGLYPGYHVVANPYPANINLSRINAGRNIGLNYWIWNPYQGKMGAYSSIPFANNYILPAFGALIVKSLANINNQLIFTENCKVSDNATDSLPNIQEDNAYHLELRLESDSVFWDRILIFEIDSAKNNVDKLDAEKLPNSDVNFYTLSRDRKMLSIDARPVNNESSIPLGIQSNEPGKFSIRVAKSVLPTNNSLQLHDKFLDKWIKLEENNRYPFLITADTNSQGNNRFEITGQKKTVLPGTNLSKLITSTTPVPANDRILVKFLSPERANTQIRIFNLYGIPIKKMALGLQKEGQLWVSIADIPKGIYLLEITSGNQVSTQKIIKE